MTSSLTIFMLIYFAQTASAMYDPMLGRFASRDTMEFPNRYAFLGNVPLTLLDPKGLSPVCSDQKCTRASRVGNQRNEGVYVAKAHVIGSKCHGTGGCCGLDGDAFAVFDFFEIHDLGTPDSDRANNELDKIGGRLRFGDASARGCTVSQTNNGGAGGVWKIHVQARCKIHCSPEPACKCKSPVELGIYADAHTMPNVGVGAGCNGADCFSIQLQANISFHNSVNCSFAGCNLRLDAFWEELNFTTPGPNWPGTGNCGPEPRRYPVTSENIRAWEIWAKCNGWVRGRTPFDTNGPGQCIGDDLNRAQQW